MTGQRLEEDYKDRKFMLVLAAVICVVCGILIMIYDFNERNASITVALMGVFFVYCLITFFRAREKYLQYQESLSRENHPTSYEVEHSTV